RASTIFANATSSAVSTGSFIWIIFGRMMTLDRAWSAIACRPNLAGMTANDRSRKFTYWIATGLLAALFLAGGILDLSTPPQVVETMARLGYPLYLAKLLGAWKLLGAVAIVAPGLPRLKEWAYAGMMFDLTGAVVSHLVVGDPLGQIVIPTAA